MDLALNNLKRLICRKTQPTNQLTKNESGSHKLIKIQCFKTEKKITFYMQIFFFAVATFFRKYCESSNIKDLGENFASITRVNPAPSFLVVCLAFAPKGVIRINCLVTEGITPRHYLLWKHELIAGFLRHPYLVNADGTRHFLVLLRMCFDLCVTPIIKWPYIIDKLGGSWLNSHHGENFQRNEDEDSGNGQDYQPASNSLGNRNFKKRPLRNPFGLKALEVFLISQNIVKLWSYKTGLSGNWSGQ